MKKLVRTKKATRGARRKSKKIQTGGNTGADASAALAATQRRLGTMMSNIPSLSSRIPLLLGGGPSEPVILYQPTGVKPVLWLDGKDPNSAKITPMLGNYYSLTTWFDKSQYGNNVQYRTLSTPVAFYGNLFGTSTSYAASYSATTNLVQLARLSGTLFNYALNLPTKASGPSGSISGYAIYMVATVGTALTIGTPGTSNFVAFNGLRDNNPGNFLSYYAPSINGALVLPSTYATTNRTYTFNVTPLGMYTNTANMLEPSQLALIGLYTDISGGTTSTCYNIIGPNNKNLYPTNSEIRIPAKNIPLTSVNLYSNTLSPDGRTGGIFINNTSLPDEVRTYQGGNVGELLIYQDTLTLEQRQTIEGQLVWKWGLQANLPPSHPWSLTGNVTLASAARALVVSGATASAGQASAAQASAAQASAVQASSVQASSVLVSSAQAAAAIESAAIANQGFTIGNTMLDLVKRPIPLMLGNGDISTYASPSPAGITPVVWLDSSDKSTILDTAGKSLEPREIQATPPSLVQTWQDKSGNGNHLALSTIASTPTSIATSTIGIQLSDQTPPRYIGTPINGLTGPYVEPTGVRFSQKSILTRGNLTGTVATPAANTGYAVYIVYNPPPTDSALYNTSFKLPQTYMAVGSVNFNDLSITKNTTSATNVGISATIGTTTRTTLPYSSTTATGNMAAYNGTANPTLMYGNTLLSCVYTDGTGTNMRTCFNTFFPFNSTFTSTSSYEVTTAYNAINPRNIALGGMLPPDPNNNVQIINQAISYTNATISEVIVYNRSLTPRQRQSIEGYLAWKWGIQNNLPDSHSWSPKIESLSAASAAQGLIASAARALVASAATASSQQASTAVASTAQASAAQASAAIANSQYMNGLRILLNNRSPFPLMLGNGDINTYTLPSPAGINPAIWLDGADTSTLLNGSVPVKIGSTTFSTWKDKSGNANDFTSTSAHAALLSNSGLRIPGGVQGGTNTFNKISINSPTLPSGAIPGYSIFMVYTPFINPVPGFVGAPARNNIYLSLGRSVGAMGRSDLIFGVQQLKQLNTTQKTLGIGLNITSGVNTDTKFFSGGVMVTNNFGVVTDALLPPNISGNYSLYNTVMNTTNTNPVLSCIYTDFAPGTTTPNATCLNTYINGTSTESRTTYNPVEISAVGLNGLIHTTSTLYRGANKVYELIIYPQTLTLAQRQNIEGYLSWKWGLEASLPTSHPWGVTNPLQEASAASASAATASGQQESAAQASSATASSAQASSATASSAQASAATVSASRYFQGSFLPSLMDSSIPLSIGTGDITTYTTPSSIKPLLWLDGADLTTMFTSTTALTVANQVSNANPALNLWRDKSGNGNNLSIMGASQTAQTASFIALTPSYATTFGNFTKPGGVSLGGNRQLFKTAMTSPTLPSGAIPGYTIYVVYKPTTQNYTTFGKILSMGNATNNIMLGYNSMSVNTTSSNGLTGYINSSSVTIPNVTSTLPPYVATAPPNYAMYNITNTNLTNNVIISGIYTDMSGGSATAPGQSCYNTFAPGTTGVEFRTPYIPVTINSLMLNGLVSGTTTAGTVFSNGTRIFEILVYPQTLTRQQRQNIEGYLAWKWGIEKNLPQSHPWAHSDNAVAASAASISAAAEKLAAAARIVSAATASGQQASMSQASAAQASGQQASAAVASAAQASSSLASAARASSSLASAAVASTAIVSAAQASAAQVLAAHASSSLASAAIQSAAMASTALVSTQMIQGVYIPTFMNPSFPLNIGTGDITTYTSPSSIKPLLWLDGADRTTMFKSTTALTVANQSTDKDARVSLWKDKSGNNNDLKIIGTHETPIVVALSAANSNFGNFTKTGGVRLGSTKQLSKTAMTSPTLPSGAIPGYTIYVVYKPSTINYTTFSKFLSMGNATNNIMLGYNAMSDNTTSSNGLTAYINSNTVTVANVTSTLPPYVATAPANYDMYNISNTNLTNNVIISGIYTDMSGGTATAPGQSCYNTFAPGTTGVEFRTPYIPVTINSLMLNGMVNTTVASAFASNTNIYELLVYPQTLTLQQRQNIEGYLAWKWSIAQTLPASHPWAYSDNTARASAAQGALMASSALASGQQASSAQASAAQASSSVASAAQASSSLASAAQASGQQASAAVASAAQASSSLASAAQASSSLASAAQESTSVASAAQASAAVASAAVASAALASAGTASAATASAALASAGTASAAIASAGQASAATASAGQASAALASAGEASAALASAGQASAATASAGQASAALASAGQASAALASAGEASAALASAGQASAAEASSSLASAALASAGQASAAEASSSLASAGQASAAQASSSLASAAQASSSLASAALASAGEASAALASSALASAALASAGEASAATASAGEASAAQASSSLASAAEASSALASSALASASLQSAAQASTSLASAAQASTSLASAAQASSSLASSAQASSSLASAALASSALASSALGSAAIAQASIESAANASNLQVSAATASALQASAALASSAQASTALASSAQQSSAQQAAMIASAATASALQASAALASSAQASTALASSAQQSSAQQAAMIASAATASALQASAALASTAEASAAQASTSLASAALASSSLASSAQASTSLASAALASSSLASSALASSALASSALASTALASSAQQSSAQQAAMIASAATANALQNSAALASAGQASAAQGSSAQALATQVSAAQASAAQGSLAQASVAIASSAQASAAQGSSAQALATQVSAANAAAIASAAQASAAQGSVAQILLAQQSAAQASTAQAILLQQSAAKASSAQAFLAFGLDPANGKYVSQSNAIDQVIPIQDFSARYVRIRPSLYNADGLIHLSQIMVMDNFNNNLATAPGVTAYASSTMPGGKPPSVVIDGVTTPRNGPNIWNANSTNRATEFIEVDLGSVQMIGGIRLVGRSDCPVNYPQCAERMTSLRIEMTTTTSSDIASRQQAAATTASMATASAAAALVSMGNDPVNGKYVASSNTLDQTIPVKEYSARYVRIRPSTSAGDGFIHLSQIIVLDGFGNNMALASAGASVYATSAMAAAKPASVVIDGTTTTRTGSNSWNAATSNRATEFIEVDLGSVQMITGIRLLGRSDCPTSYAQCADRMMNLRIEMNTTTTPEVTAYYTTQGSSKQASAAAANASAASAATASALQASAATASAGQASAAQKLVADAAALQASAATASAAQAAVAQASAAKQSAAAALVTMGNDPTTGKYVASSNALDQTIPVTDYPARYVRIRPSLTNGDGMIHLSQIMVMDNFGNNLAEGKNVYASSTATAGKPATVVTDGTTTTRTGANSWNAANTNRATEFIEVDLGSVQTIGGIRLLGRSDCPPNNPQCADRMMNLRVEMSTTTSPSVTDYHANRRSNLQASAATVLALQASAATASAVQVSTAKASAAQASAAEKLVADASVLQASAATASAAQAAVAQASAAKQSAAVALVTMGNDPTTGKYVASSNALDQTLPVSEYSARYVRIRPSTANGDGFIHLSQIMVLDSFGNNLAVAQGTNVYASSTMAAAKPASVVIDGTTTTRTGSNIWNAATSNRATEFIEVDLGSVQTISAVRLLGRSDCPTSYAQCADRMMNLRVEMNTTTTPEVTAFYTTQGSSKQASAASAATASALQASNATASAAKASAAQAFDVQNTYLKASAATASSAMAAAAGLVSMGNDPVNGKYVSPSKALDQILSISDYSARYVRIRPPTANGDGFIHLSQIMVMDNFGNNLAAGANVYASSTATAGKSATVVTDGTTTTRTGPNIWNASTSNRGTEFIEVDLGSVQMIGGIRLIGRSDCPPNNPNCADRMMNLRVEMTTTTTPEVTAYYTTQSTGKQASAAAAAASAASAATASALQASNATASAAKASAAQALDVQNTYLKASAATASSAMAAAAQASAATQSAAASLITMGNDPVNGKYVSASSSLDQTIAVKDYSARYVRIKPSLANGDGFIHLSQIVVMDNFGNNLAKDANVYASSTATAGKPASVVIDGNTAMRTGVNSWNAATANRATEFIEVDLGSVQMIGGIRLVGRSDCPVNYPNCADRMMNLRIEMNTTTTPEVTAYYTTQGSSKQASAASVAASSASAATASALQASNAVASAAQASAAQVIATAVGLVSMGNDPANGKYVASSNTLDQTIPVKEYSARYVRIRPSTANADGFIHLSQIMVLDSFGNNMALATAGANVYASSAMAAAKPASVVIDGTTTTRTGSNSWNAASSNRATEFIEVDLGSVQTISAVRLLGRSDCPTSYLNCADRMMNLRIEMNTTTTPDVTAYYGTQMTKAQASAAAVNASSASAATASALQASAAKASSVQASAAQALATVSAAQGSAAQAFALAQSAAQALISMGNDPKNGKYVSSSSALDQTIPVEYSARYIRIRPSTSAADGFINLSQIMILDEFGNNLAATANIYSTSAKAAAKQASVLLDGNTTSRTAVNSWNSASSNRATEFIEVDLGSVQAIGSIRLIGPSDCPANNPKCAERMSNLRIEMSTTTTPDVIAYYSTQTSKTQASSASAATASALQASTAKASAAQASVAQALTLEANALQASAAVASAAVGSAAQAFAVAQSAAQALISMGNDPKNGKFVSASSALDQTIPLEYSARYIRIRPSTSAADGFISFSQIMVLDDFGNNLATQGNVYATSTRTAAKPAFVVIDGNTTSRTAVNSWNSASSNRATEFIEVDLGSVQAIAGIRLLGPSDCPPNNPKCADRMSNLRIEMSTTTTPDVTAYYGTQTTKAQESAAAANASAASAATASALQVSAAKASAAQESAAQKLGVETTTLKASAATVSAAQAAAAQASNAVASAAAGLINMGSDPANGKYISSSNSLDQTLPVEYSARYVRIRPSTAAGDGFINLSQIIVTDDFGNNLAAQGNVYATSAKTAAKPASVVIDGNTSSRIAANSWNSNTGNRNTEFIEVDLGSVQAISSIRLIGPSDCPPNNPKCADRMMNLRIEMNTTTTPEVTSFYTTQGSKLQASAAAVVASAASAATASALQASTAVASAAQVATAQAATLQASVATASTAMASAAAAASAQASAAVASAAVGLLNMGSDPAAGKFISASNALDQTIITNYSARYVRIRPSTSTADGFIHLSQIMVVDDFANNMAVGANVYATSVMPAGKPASVVIDGTATTRTGANIWNSTTGNRNTEFIEVDLGSVQTISAVRLIGRSDCPLGYPKCADRMSNLRIELNPTTTPEVTTYYTTQGSKVQASAAQASAAQASAATASSLQASAAVASAAKVFDAQKLSIEDSAAKASAAQVQAAINSAAQASAAIQSAAKGLINMGDDAANGSFILPTNGLDQIVPINYSARYVRIRPSTANADGFIHLSQIMVLDDLGNNLAQGTNVYATSTVTSAKPASVVIDGNTTMRTGPNVWNSASPNRATEFIEVDLGTVQAIASIRLIGRSDCSPTYKNCADRMTNLRIQLSDTTTPDVTNHYAAKVSGANASAAQASALQASTATASAGQASAVQASAATASAGQASTLQASVATASAAQASAVASAAQANAAKELAIGESAAKVSAAQASAASASAAQASASTEAMGDNAAMGRYILPTNGLDQTLPVDYSARYIRIRPPTLAGDGFINLSQIIVTDDFGNNIVKGANVYATSAKPAAKPASVVVDGTTTMRTAVNSWNAVTSKRATEFIEVDLGSVQAITSVRLIGPSDCPPNNPKCADRMMNLRIEMSTTTTPEVSDYYAEKASKLQASAAAAAASSASAATASSLQASAAVASAAQAFDTQRLGIEGSAAKASAAQAQAAIVSAAVASERQAADAKHLSLKDSSAKASAATASAAQASAASIAMGDDPTNGRYILPTNDKDQTIATNNTGQYIRIRPSTTSDGYLQLSQIFVYDPTGTNIAPGCFIFATSSFEQFKDPKILIDETAKIRTAPNIWQSATNNKNTEYVEIDLGSPQEISGIRLLGRGTCPSTMPNCQDRMRNVRLEINMDTNQELIDAQEGEAAAAAAKIKTAEEAVVSAAKAVEQQALADAKMTAQESAAKASAARAATDQDSAAKKAVRDGYDALAASAAQASAAIASVAIYRRSIGDIPEAGKFILTSSKTDQSLLFKQSGGGQEGGSQLIQTALGNDVMGRYVLVRPSVNKGDGYIHFSQIVVYDVLGDNMAVGKPVFATSTMRNTKEPSILVDGKMKPRKPPYIWHSATPDRENEFVEIDLGSMQTITGLRFIGRADCPITIPKCQERMLELRVEINEEPSEEGKAFFDDMGDDMEVQASMAQASAAVASAAVASAAAASTAKAAELAEDLAAGSDPKNGSFILPKAGRDQTMLINYKGRYLRVMPPATESDGWIHFSQIMVFNMEKNVALGMPVYATSTLDGAAAPSIVVDGNTELRGIPDIWHSATTDRSEYIEIDLGKETHVTSVRIIGRNDCPIVAWCDDRMNKLRIQVRNDTDADATATYMQIKSLQASAANALPVPVKPVPAPEPAPDTSRPVTPVPKPADVDVDTDVIANPIKTPYTPTAPMIIPQAVPMPIYIPSFNPQQFNPQQFNPQQFNPQQFNPQQFNPQGNPQGNPQRRNPEDSESESRYRKPRRYEVPSIQTKEPRLPHQTYSIQKGPRGIPYHTPRPSPRPKPNPLEPVDSEPSNSDPSQGRYVTGQSGGGKSLQDMSVNVNEYVARYVRILPSLKGDGYMNISQIMVFSILNVNLAAGQPVYATSTMDGSSPPSIVVDGSTRVRGLPNIWHSASTDKNEFIEIDLGSSQGIHSIRILGRNDCPIQGLCDARMNGLRVQLNEETSEDAMAAYKGPLPLPLPLPAAPLPAAPLPAAPLPAAPTASMPTASMPSRTVNVAGSTNTSGSITINKSACLAPVDTPDPSLPNGFERLWDTKGRKYVYQFNGQIVAHPIPPSKRVNRSYVQRPSGLPTVTRQQEAQILNLKGGGVSPLPTDIQIISDPNTTPPWKKYFDTLIRKYYYVTDKDERWEHPYTPRKPVNGEMKYGDPALPQGWDKYLDNSTNTYFYYYPSTGETTWDHPSPPPFPHGLDVISNNHISDLYTMYRDPSLKEIFYFNTVTTETFWILPQGILGGESAPGILSSNPVEAFTCQRIDVVAPGSIKLSPDNPNYIMTSHTPISMPVITSGPTASAAIAATASAASASAATASAATASEATASRP